MNTKLIVGDYVLATKYNDGGPNDHWCVGYYAGELPNGKFNIVGSDGYPFRLNGFKRCKKISSQRGEFILKNAELIENSTRSLWWRGRPVGVPTTR